MKRVLFSRLSIRQRLPLVICSLLLAVILVFGIVSYLSVRNAELKEGRQRLHNLALQLSSLLSASAQNTMRLTYAAANRPAVKTYLLSGKDSITETRKGLQEVLRDSASVAVQLLSAEQKALLILTRGEGMLPFPHLSINAEGEGVDSCHMGNIYAIGKQLYYPVIARVADAGQTRGFLVRWRQIRPASATVRQLSQLMGQNAKFYVGNADGSLWTDMMAPVPTPLTGKRYKNNVFQYERAGEPVLASVKPVANSRWLVAVEFPKTSLRETSNNYLYWLLMAGGILLVAGTFCGWLMSRNLSEPIANLTAAASQIAAGNYSPQVPVNRMDEVGKLARSFHAMTVQIQNSQKELEEKAERYRLLFEKNPIPMWIMGTKTLQILDVNEAAVHHYGYTKEEFLQLNATALRPDEDIPKFLSTVPQQLKGRKPHGIWRHKKKDGRVIMVDISTDDMLYKNEMTTIVLANDVTEKLNAEAELVRHRQMQQEMITEAALLAQEKEREEIGKELHDNINQILASTKLYLELARSGNKDLLRQAVEKSYENINLAIGEIRHLSKQLVKPSFDTSLKDTLRELTDELEAITPIHITFDASGFEESKVDESIKVMIYRIVQEQMNNILKHAAASEVRITLKTNGESVEFCIKDDGVGFDVHKKAKGIGLRNIDSRVKFHKGNLKICSAPGEGCTISIEVPLKQRAVLFH